MEIECHKECQLAHMEELIMIFPVCYSKLANDSLARTSNGRCIAPDLLVKHLTSLLDL